MFNFLVQARNELRDVLSFRKNRKDWLISLKLSFLISLPVTLVAFHSYVNTYEDLTSRVITEKRSQVYLASAMLHERLTKLIDVGVSLASRTMLNDAVAAGRWEMAARELAEVPRTFPFIERIFLADAGGTIMTDTVTLPGVEGAGRIDKDCYKGLSARWQPYLSGVYKSAVEPYLNVVDVAVPITARPPVMQPARPATDAAQNIVGILILQIKLETFSQWIRDVDVGRGAIIYIVDQNGRLVFHPKYPAQGNIVNFAGSPAVHDLVRRWKGVEAFFNPAEKAKKLTAYAPVSAFGWGVVIEQNPADAFAYRNRDLRFILTAYMVIIIFGFFLSYLVIYVINERKRQEMIEEALEDSERTCRTIGEMVPYGIWISDAEGGITYLSRSFLEMAGMTLEECRGSGWTSRMIPQDRELMLAHWTHCVKNCIYWEYEFRIRTRDGGYRTIFSKGMPIRDSKNRIAFWAGVNFDITDRKMMEENLRQAKERAESANRAKSDFLASMSHELRTPLNSVIGFAEILKDKLYGELNARQEEYLDDIYSSGKHLLHLINDILDLSKIESRMMQLDLSALSVRHALSESASIFKDSIMKHGIHFNLVVEPEADILIEADGRKLKQVMYNLLSNALKFTPDGGSVRVFARKTVDPSDIEVSVKDTGIGIRREDMHRLFGEFSQIESVYTRKAGGTGLGLALSSKIVTLHGGRIWAESAGPGKGSTFTFTVPVRVPPQQ